MDPLKSITPTLKSPFVVCMWIADTCNLNCKYCYAMPFKGTLMQEDRMLKLADEIIEMDVFDVTLAGGEPFLNPGIYKLIERFLKSGINLGVLSNGTLFSEDTIQKLLSVVKGYDNFLLQISLDGLYPETHDKTRGKGNLVIENLNRLCEKTNIRLQIATVLNTHNISEIYDLIDTYYPRVKRFHLMNLQRTDQSLKYDDMFISEDENKKFWQALENHMKKMPKDILITGLNIMRLMHRMEDDPEKFNPGSTFNCASCTAGVTHVEITSDFDVIGCDIAKEFTWMGNVKNSSLKKVWFSEQADKIRAYPFPACYLIKDPKGNCLAEQYLNKDIYLKYSEA